MATIKDLQLKLLYKIESKEKGGIHARVLRKYFEPFDKDGDGDIRLPEFMLANERIGSPLNEAEAQFLFSFWDTMAGQREECGQVEINLMVQDLLASMPTYSNGFNSGNELVKTTKGARGNMPSQTGGIFGGGSYEADARNELPERAPPRAVEAAMPMGGMAERPKGNQSSIPGGIFGGADAAPPPPSAASGGRSNRSNQSSIPGGIFGEAPACAPAQRNGRNSNASSIPGGIFG